MARKAKQKQKLKPEPEPEPRLTFRQLVEKIGRDDMPVDTHRTITDVAQAAGVSRPHFYHALRGTRGVTWLTVQKMAKGLRKLAPWVTEEQVKAAVEYSRALYHVQEMAS